MDSAKDIGKLEGRMDNIERSVERLTDAIHGQEGDGGLVKAVNDYRVQLEVLQSVLSSNQDIVIQAIGKITTGMETHQQDKTIHYSKDSLKRELLNDIFTTKNIGLFMIIIAVIGALSSAVPLDLLFERLLKVFGL